MSTEGSGGISAKFHTIRYYIVLNTLLSHILQLDQEMDLILDQKDIVKTTVNSWRAKWAPAVLCYAEGLTSKSAKTILKEAQTMFKGMKMQYTCTSLICTVQVTGKVTNSRM